VPNLIVKKQHARTTYRIRIATYPDERSRTCCKQRRLLWQRRTK